MLTPGTWEAEEEGSFWVRGHSGLNRVFQDSQLHIVKLCLKKRKEEGKEESKQWRNTADNFFLSEIDLLKCYDFYSELLAVNKN